MLLPFMDLRWSISVWNSIFLYHISSYRSIAMSEWANLDVDSLKMPILVDCYSTHVKLTLSSNCVCALCMCVVNQKVQLCHKQQIYLSSCHRYRKPSHSYYIVFRFGSVSSPRILSILSSRRDLMFQHACLCAVDDDALYYIHVGKTINSLISSMFVE